MPELDRRDFLKLVGAGAGAAAAAGCSEHVEKLIPYVIQPEEITPGNPVYYASTCRECPAGCGLHVKTREGRPIKLEGNPEHPVNRGKLCARGQAGIGRTYHPDRFAGPMRRAADGSLQPISWQDAVAELAAEIGRAPQKTFVLGGEVGPTLSELLDQFVRSVGAGGRTVYEPFAPEALREATRSLFGVASVPVFDLSEADLIVDFGSDFLETGLSPTEHAGQLAEARDVAAHPDGGARLVSVGPRLSMTVSNADEWLAARPGSEGILALALARVAIENGAGGAEHQALLGGLLAELRRRLRGRDRPTSPAADDRAARQGARPGEARRRAAARRGALEPARRRHHGGGAAAEPRARRDRPRRQGAAGRRSGRSASYKETLALVEAMKAGSVGVLLVHDANPVYSLPAAVGLRQGAREGEARRELRADAGRDHGEGAPRAARPHAARVVGRRVAARRACAR